MTPISLTTAEQLAPQVQRILSEVFAQLEALLPEAELHHIGATAIPGALTKGDLDVLVRVPGACFQTAVDRLKREFTIRQPANWTVAFASFGDDTGFELPLGIQVVVKNANDDYLLFLRDYLVSHHDALAEYNRLKVTHAPEGSEEYWKAKDRFLAGILSKITVHISG